MTEKKLGRSTQAFTASAGWLVANQARIAERRGRNIATMATAPASRSDTGRVRDHGEVAQLIGPTRRGRNAPCPTPVRTKG